MHFVAFCLDKPNSLATRLDTRPAHLAYLGEKAEMVKLAGPFLDAAGQPCGTMLVLECPDEPSAQGFLAGDPYAKAGLFGSVELRPFKPVLGTLLA